MGQSASEAQPGSSSKPLTADEFEEAQVRAAAPRPYEFRTGDELSRESVYQLRSHCEKLCNVFGRIIGAYLDTTADAELTSVQAVTFNQYVESLPDLSVAAHIQVAEHMPEIIWQIDGNLTGVIIGRMLGGAATTLDRPPTLLEASLLKRFIQELIDIWATIWEGLSECDAMVTQVLGDLSELPTSAEDKHVVRLLMRTQLGEEQGKMSVCLPVATSRRLLEAEESSVQATAAPSPLVLSDPVGQVKVPVSLVVHQSAISLREAMRLRPGDVIPLRKPLDAPLTLAVRGRAKFLAQAGVRQGHLAARLLAPSDDFAP